MAVGDIGPVSRAQFDETLASARPVVLREMIREFAQRMMDAEVEVRCNAGYGEVTPQRVNSATSTGWRSGMGSVRWLPRCAWRAGARWRRG